MTDLNLATAAEREAKYVELMGQFDAIMEWLNDMHTTFPKSNRAAELRDIYNDVSLGLNSNYEYLINGRVNWQDDRIVELIKLADNMRMEVSDIVKQMDFQLDLAESQDPDFLKKVRDVFGNQ